VKSKSKEEELAKSLAEMRVLDGLLREIEARINVINAVLTELSLSLMTLRNVENKKDAEILVPIGGGSYIRAKIEDAEKVIMGIGSDVALERGIKESVESIKERARGLEVQRGRLEEQREKVLIRLGEVRKKVVELSRERMKRGS
jgi:prefoldin alpha subunit